MQSADVALSGFHEHRKRSPSERSIRHAMLTDLITQIHVESHGIYGGRRVHAELTLGRGVVVGTTRCNCCGVERAWPASPDAAGGSGSCPAPSPPTGSNDSSTAPARTSSGSPTSPNTRPHDGREGREGKIYCWVILDTYSRRVVGWSIDASPTGALKSPTPSPMAIDSRLDKTIDPGTIIHSDQGVQGEFNRSSQHLGHGGARWDAVPGHCRWCLRALGGSGRRVGRCGRRCVRRVGPSRLVRCSGSSGGWSRRE